MTSSVVNMSFHLVTAKALFLIMLTPQGIVAADDLTGDLPIRDGSLVYDEFIKDELINDETENLSSYLSVLNTKQTIDVVSLDNETINFVGFGWREEQLG